MSLRVGDVVSLSKDDQCMNLMREAEVIQTPAGEGDVWGFRDLADGAEMYTSEKFTARVLRRKAK